MDISGLFKSKPQPREIARDRLKLVLISDRFNCSPQVLEKIRMEIIKVISNYMYVDEGDMDIQILQGEKDSTGNGPMLLANVPIRGVRKSPNQI